MSKYDDDCSPTHLTVSDEQALRFAADYRCPDCAAEKLFWRENGMWMLSVLHDDTCPKHRAMMGGAA